MPVAGLVTLEVFDLLGRPVAMLVGGVQEASHHSVRFDAAGRSIGSYFYPLSAASAIQVKGMLFVE